MFSRVELTRTAPQGETMTIRRSLYFCAWTVLLSATLSYAAEPKPAAKSGLDTMVSVDVKGAPLADFLDTISAQAKVNFILREGADKEKVTAKYPKSPVKDVLTKTLAEHNLAYYQLGKGTTYLVMRADQPAPKDPGEGIQDPALDKKVTVRLKGGTVGSFLGALAKQSGLKFGMTDDLKKLKLTLFLKNVTAREALAVVVMTKGLTYQKDEKTGTYNFSLAP